MEAKHLEKIAKMVIANVPQNQIASACNVSEGAISQIINTEDYKKIEQVIAVAKFEESQLINQGWDSVEALGVKTTIMALQNNPEPDFALRAAVVANKAIRRGTHANNPIPQSAGVRAVIHLNPTFVNKLQQNFEISEDKAQALAEKPKDSDFLPASEVHNLLSTNKDGESLSIGVEIPVTSPEIDAENANKLLDDMDFDI
ncbi:MAG TPA: hypothetical protein ENJ28_04960 [Gammaproteobacteria bacterium]|nr:hypothetical protein [Gammaproteobacteria bacterium]